MEDDFTSSGPGNNSTAAAHTISSSNFEMNPQQSSYGPGPGFYGQPGGGPGGFPGGPTPGYQAPGPMSPYAGAGPPMSPYSNQNQGPPPPNGAPLE